MGLTTAFGVWLPCPLPEWKSPVEFSAESADMLPPDEPFLLLTSNFLEPSWL